MEWESRSSDGWSFRLTDSWYRKEEEVPLFSYNCVLTSEVKAFRYCCVCHNYMGWRKLLLHFSQHLLNHLWNTVSSFNTLMHIRKMPFIMSKSSKGSLRGVVGLEQKTCEKRLGEPGMFSLEIGELRVDLMADFSYLWGDAQEDQGRFFSELHSGRARDSGHKLELFKSWLHKPLSNLVWIWCWACLLGRGTHWIN